MSQIQEGLRLLLIHCDNTSAKLAHIPYWDQHVYSVVFMLTCAVDTIHCLR